MEHVTMIDDTVDLINDAEDRSWYFQRYTGANTVESQSFKTREEAMEALKYGRLEWE